MILRRHSRFPELVLFKDGTYAVQPLSLASDTAKDVPRIVIVRLDGRSEGNFIAVRENLFGNAFSIHLFHHIRGQPVVTVKR